MSQSHAFVIAADAEEGIAVAQTWIAKELGMQRAHNPDVTVVSYGLFSVADARRISEMAAGTAFVGASNVLIITASRIYHEAQNALLKIFEEPPVGTYLFLIVPTLGGLLPTLRSRVQVLSTGVDATVPKIAPATEAFLNATEEKRHDIIKRLTSGKDEEKRREQRDEAIALLNDIEAVAYALGRREESDRALLRDIAVLRGYLYERSAPVRMILEHLALVLPHDLPARASLV